MIDKNVWKRIRKFQDEMENPFPLKGPLEQKYWATMYTTALMMEASELMESFQWKPWRKNFHVNRSNVKREIVDCIYFLHHVARCFDISLDELNRKFEEVDENNKIRYIDGDFSQEDEEKSIGDLMEEMKIIIGKMEKEL